MSTVVVRERAPSAPGAVPDATWWSSREVQVPGGRWCREPPEYAAVKPPLPMTEPGAAWKDTPPKLTREFVLAHASPTKFIIATYVNYKRLDFAYTMVRHLKALGQPHYIVGAMDLQALEGLLQHTIPAFYIDSGLPTHDYGWGTPNFRKMGLHKVQLVLDLAKLGVDALTVDADAFILREPWQYIRRFPRADVLMSSDLLRATRGYNHTGLEDASGFGADFNIGYIFIRSAALEFVQRWRDACFRSPNAWDQQLFAMVLRSGGQRGATMTAKNLRPMFKTSSGRSLLAGVLPVALFASGHTFFVTRMAHQMHRQPFMVHTTFQYAGSEGKRHRLREGMMWEDAPDYYSTPSLTYTPDIPYALVYPNGRRTVRGDGSVAFQHRMSVAQHFELVNHQLAQIRDAFALAQALGRVLILPRIVCGLDRYGACTCAYAHVHMRIYALHALHAMRMCTCAYALHAVRPQGTGRPTEASYQAQPRACACARACARMYTKVLGAPPRHHPGLSHVAAVTRLPRRPRHRLGAHATREAPPRAHAALQPTCPCRGAHLFTARGARLHTPVHSTRVKSSRVKCARECGAATAAAAEFDAHRRGGVAQGAR